MLAGLVASVLVVASAVACSREAANVVPIRFEVSLTSVAKDLYKVGPNDSIVYGRNLLEGDALIDGEAVHVEMFGHVEYVNGGGDFDGPVTLTFEDGSLLGFDMVNGVATARTDTSDARFSALIRIIGGTGRFLNASGRGTLHGRRNDALGGVVEMTFEMNVQV